MNCVVTVEGRIGDAERKLGAGKRKEVIGLNETANEAENTVMKYIRALDSNNYEEAAEYIDEKVKIIGPAGESFGKPREFTRMLERFKGRYEIKRTFVDGDEVCLLYDFQMGDVTVYMSSWYRVRSGRIVFIRTIFDPAAFP